MARLIDADKCHSYFYDHLDEKGVVGAMNAVEEMPTIDAVEVVHCKDCKHALENHYEEPGEPPYIKYLCNCPYGLSSRYGIDKNDFCSRGERNMDAEVEG